MTKTAHKGFDLTNHPLAQFVPNSSFHDTYVGRLVGGVEDMTILTAAHRMGHNVLIAGPTGSAKTTFVYAYAAREGMPVVNVPCNGAVDVRQLIGGWTPKPDGTYHFVPGDLVLGVMNGAVILLNEVNFMPPKIAAYIFGLLDGRRTIFLPDAAGSDFPTVIKAHPKTLFVADYNPGYQGTRPLNQAFRNRFAVKLDWGYSHDVETQLLVSPSLLELAEKLRARIDAGDLFTPVPTNMLMEFEDFAQSDDLGFEFAVHNFVSAFEVDEQPVVREVLSLYSDRIYNDLFEVVVDDDDGHSTTMVPVGDSSS